MRKRRARPEAESGSRKASRIRKRKGCSKALARFISATKSHEAARAGTVFAATFMRAFHHRKFLMSRTIYLSIRRKQKFPKMREKGQPLQVLPSAPEATLFARRQEPVR